MAKQPSKPMTQRFPRDNRARLRLFLILLLPLILLAFPFSLANAHLVSGMISYSTAWNIANITRDDNGSGWRVVTDLGYTVHVTRGHIVSHSTTLNECPHLTGVTDWFASLFSTSVAHAGHGEGGPDQAVMAISQVESLTVLKPLELGTVGVHEYSYCKGHYLVAQASTLTRDLPNDVPMLGHSIYIEGTYQAPGSTDPIPFTVKTSDPNGKLFDLELATGNAAIHGIIGADTLAITISRRVDGLFNHIDFATMDDAARAQIVLDNLIANTRMIVTGGKWR